MTLVAPSRRRRRRAPEASRDGCIEVIDQKLPAAGDGFPQNLGPFEGFGLRLGRALRNSDRINEGRWNLALAISLR
jgi:hypothetical protein